jgi:hypothetical protein
VVEVTPRIRATYEERVEGAGLALREQCADRGVTYVRAPTDVAPIDLLFGAARDTGLISV